MNITFLFVVLGKILISIILLGLLFSPVIFIGVAFIMILFGKYHVLKSWIKKYGMFGDYTPNQFNKSISSKKNEHKKYGLISRHDTNPSNRARYSRFTTTSSNSSSYSRTNPASGRPMVGSSSIDSGGNVYGTRR